LKWFRGEFSTKTDVRAELGIREMIDDSNWYEYLKILGNFVKSIGYTGFLIFIDEVVNLYKISNKIARNNNYERFLTIYNDILQGNVSYMGFYFCCTPKTIEDTLRGFFSYEALSTRLQVSKYSQEGYIDFSGPIIRLSQLKAEEIFVLLQRIAEIYSFHYKTGNQLSDNQIQLFMNETVKRLGSEQLNTPREMIRDFVSVLNILRQNVKVTFESLILGDDFKPTSSLYDPETTESILLDDNDNKEESSSSFSKFKI
ncbi:MAG: BREX system ATP-binding domain-containing protein, partial [Candidatus Thorarchaeota archaeon]